MVTWNVPFERELIKQSSLFDLPMPHHDSQSCLSQRLNQGTSCVATEDFFNKICQKETSCKFQIEVTEPRRPPGLQFLFVIGFVTAWAVLTKSSASGLSVRFLTVTIEITRRV